MGIKHILSLILFISLVFSAMHSYEVRADGANSPPKITTEQIKALNLEGLLKLRDHMSTLFSGVKAIIGRPKATVPQNTKVILELSLYETQETVETLYALFRSELKRVSDGDLNGEVFFTTLHAIAQIGNAMPSRYAEEFDAIVEETLGRMPAGDDNAGLQVLKQHLQATQTAVNSRKYPYVNLNDLIAAAQSVTSTPQEALKNMESILRRRIIGQPEVIEAFMTLEWRSRIYGGARILPDAVYLMGLPGTGKDTAAEAFADALHGYDGAWKTHLFRLPIMKRSPHLWQVLGSTTGYVGSEAFPPFLSFLVQHSGGKYKIKTDMSSQGKPVYSIIDNPEYKGETLPGYYAPGSAVVFANEFHNWSKQLKDDFLKQALERGYFTINNPNGGLAEIYVPVHFIMASNEGINLVTSREANGQRHGKAMSYDQILHKWEKIHDNKPALKNEILATNGAVNASANGDGEAARGISEEVLNRIDNRFVLEMRPLSPEDLKSIVENGLNDLKQKFSGGSGFFKAINLTWNKDFAQKIQEYDYVAEENARPVLNLITGMVEEPLINAIRKGQISPTQALNVNIDFVLNDNGTRDLLIEMTQANGKSIEVREPIPMTEKDQQAAMISDARIDELSRLESELKSAVFGIDPILERLAQRILSIENDGAGKNSRPANLIMLTGLSSTGKTETAKQLSAKVSGADDELKTFDFSQIQTLHDFKVKILGLKDAQGSPIASEFMKLYDRNNGKMVVAFDELANVRDPDLLKSLYDLFRESIVTTFSDGKPRPMGGVTIIITGNPGQESYAKVPRHVPMEVQMAGWAEIYRQTNNNLEVQRQILERVFPEPLITRVGRNNIFFVPPHSYQSLRQLTQLKLGQAIENIKSTVGRRGWKVSFPTTEEYSRFVDTVIEEGFSLRYQGASIDSFIKDDFEVTLNSLLLNNKVPSGAKVVLRFNNKTDNSNEDVPGYVTYDVFVDGRNIPLTYKFRRPHVEKPLEANLIEQTLTAFHEAGHSVVRQALFGDATLPIKITVIPGVAMIGGEWLYYAGVAVHQDLKSLSSTRAWVLSQIAVLAAGETAERLVSKGHRHSAGKSNDVERATRLARDSILKYGLSESWGIRAIPSGVSVEDYIDGLSEGQKQILEREEQKMIAEGRDLAERTLKANFDNAFIPLGIDLVEKGELLKQDLQDFYAQHSLNQPKPTSTLSRAFNSLRNRLAKIGNKEDGNMEVQIDESLPKPKMIADLAQMSLASKQAQYAEVPIPANAPIATNQAYEQTFKSVGNETDCERILETAI